MSAAPLEKNLADYLRKHPDCEVYNGQDKLLTPDEILVRSQHRIDSKSCIGASGPRNLRWRTTDLSGKELPVFTSQKDKKRYLHNEWNAKKKEGGSQKQSTFGSQHARD